MKHTYTREDIKAIYKEAERRINDEIKDRASDPNNEKGYVSKEEIEEFRSAVLQGVYSALMATTDNFGWRRAVGMLDAEEEERHWRDLGYED